MGKLRRQLAEGAVALARRQRKLRLEARPAATRLRHRPGTLHLPGHTPSTTGRSKSALAFNTYVLVQVLRATSLLGLPSYGRWPCVNSRWWMRERHRYNPGSHAWFSTFTKILVNMSGVVISSESGEIASNRWQSCAASKFGTKPQISGHQ